MLRSRFVLGWSACMGAAGAGLFAAGIGETTAAGLLLGAAVLGLVPLAWFGWRR